jgi:hypothetical protein
MDVVEELSKLLPDVDQELLSVLIDSTGGVVSRALVSQLKELHQGDIELITVDNHGNVSPPERALCGTVLLWVPMDATVRVSFVPPILSDSVQIIFGTVLQEFGVYSFRIQHEGRVEEVRTCFVTSAVYEYSRALDDIYDALYWSWSQRSVPVRLA